LISFYGDSLESVVPKYLEQSMHSFAHNQDQMKKSMQEAFGGITPFSNIGEVGKQNMAMFESAMKMFTPFGANGTGGAQPSSSENNSPAPDTEPEDNDDLSSLRDQIDAMQQQLNKMSKK